MKISPISPGKIAPALNKGESYRALRAYPRSSSIHVNALAKESGLDIAGAKEELKKLSADLKNQVVGSEQAAGKFLSIVFKDTLHGQLSEKDYEKLMSFMEEFLQSDPDFMHRLIKNLKTFT